MPVQAFRALGVAGLVPKNTELLYGFVYAKPPKSPYHSYLVQLLVEVITTSLPTGFLLRAEQPLTLGDSEPEPDLAVVAGRNEDFRLDHPHTASLVIEVSLSSLDYDRAKLRAYATAGVDECWLVLGHEKQVEVYRYPEAGQYLECARHEAGGQLQSSSVPTTTVGLDSLFAL